jgi:hypothetical protein
MKSIKSQKDEEGKRKYLLFLLYDLQERVEKQYEEGKISSQDASGMINTILTAKEAVNEGKDKNQIRSTLVELKELWKAKIK